MENTPQKGHKDSSAAGLEGESTPDRVERMQADGNGCESPSAASNVSSDLFASPSPIMNTNTPVGAISMLSESPTSPAPTKPVAGIKRSRHIAPDPSSPSPFHLDGDGDESVDADQLKKVSDKKRARLSVNSPLVPRKLRYDEVIPGHA